MMLYRYIRVCVRICVCLCVVSNLNSLLGYGGVGRLLMTVRFKPGGVAE